MTHINCLIQSLYYIKRALNVFVYGSDDDHLKYIHTEGIFLSYFFFFSSTTDSSVVTAMEKRMRGSRRGCRGINGHGQRFALRWWTHNTVYWWCVVELCPWSPCNFVNQCLHNKFIKKIFFKKVLKNVKWLKKLKIINTVLFCLFCFISLS